jgi:DNA-directed RNA polymerase subunit RPC12/RpoP
MKIVTTKNRTPVALDKAGHPAAYRKIRCPVCRQGYGVHSNTEDVYVCDRCGRTFKSGKL